ncbi:MAG: type II secretion system protein [Candidatus Hydrogenedentes bacterium]|nr:type II secretion system protein [Candidatus Hydrogenedentota bacterium]
MKRNQGFTLIELLVVMAIIAILASIVVPNIVGWIARARMTRAQSEIESIELALSKMLSDVGRNSLNDLIDTEQITKFVLGLPLDNSPLPDGAVRPPMNAALFARVQQLYTNAFYALLRVGRNARTSPDPDGLVANYGQVLRGEVVKQLGTTYLEIGYDPWGQHQYQIFPAPWGRGSATQLNPNIFRVYQRVEPEGRELPGKTATDVDPPGMDLTLTNEDGDIVGLPATRNPGVAFIYSYGANMISGQLVYRNYLNEGKLQYPDQELEFMGGGDDVNNWDTNFTWQRFYG